MIKLVAFDWNGTILSDTNGILAGDNVVLENFGFPKTNLKEIQAKFRIPIREFWIAMGLDVNLFDDDPDKIYNLFMEGYEPYEKIARTRSGTREILRWLQTQNITTIVFSNHIIHHIKKQITRLKIATYIDTILARNKGDNSHLHEKTKDQKLSKYVRTTKLENKEVLVVGDTEEEIEIAQKFGYYSVALTGGNISTKRLKAARPDFLVHNLIELKKIINQLNNGRTVARNY